MNYTENKNKTKAEQTALPSKYPQGYFKPKPCKLCSTQFTPNAPSEHYCSDLCKDTAITDNYLYRNYGITIINYKEILHKQNSVCAICGETGLERAIHSKSKCNLVVDHCHTTNKVRGLLCHTCNTALGQFKDSKQLLERAIKYLGTDLELETPLIEKTVKVRAVNMSNTEALAIITDSIKHNLSRKELVEKYNRSEGVIRGITELKNQLGKKAFETYKYIEESATTIPNGSTSQANGDGSGEPLLIKEGEDIV